jgi:hypothetical protein
MQMAHLISIYRLPALEKTKNPTGYLLLRVADLTLFCVCIYQQNRFLMERGRLLQYSGLDR